MNKNAVISIKTMSRNPLRFRSHGHGVPQTNPTDRAQIHLIRPTRNFVPRVCFYVEYKGETQ